MRKDHNKSDKQISLSYKVGNSFITVLKSWYFYIGFLSVIAGMELTYIS